MCEVSKCPLQARLLGYRGVCSVDIKIQAQGLNNPPAELPAPAAALRPHGMLALPSTRDFLQRRSQLKPRPWRTREDPSATRPSPFQQEGVKGSQQKVEPRECGARTTCSCSATVREETKGRPEEALSRAGEQTAEEACAAGAGREGHGRCTKGPPGAQGVHQPLGRWESRPSITGLSEGAEQCQGPRTTPQAHTQQEGLPPTVDSSPSPQSRAEP